MDTAQDYHVMKQVMIYSRLMVAPCERGGEDLGVLKTSVVSLSLLYIYITMQADTYKQHLGNDLLEG